MKSVTDPRYIPVVVLATPNVVVRTTSTFRTIGQGGAAWKRHAAASCEGLWPCAGPTLGRGPRAHDVSPARLIRAAVLSSRPNSCVEVTGAAWKDTLIRGAGLCRLSARHNVMPVPGTSVKLGVARTPTAPKPESSPAAGHFYTGTVVANGLPTEAKSVVFPISTWPPSRCRTAVSQALAERSTNASARTRLKVVVAGAAWTRRGKRRPSEDMPALSTCVWRAVNAEASTANLAAGLYNFQSSQHTVKL